MNIFTMFNQLKSNPAQLLSQRFNLPSDINYNNPNDIIQHLLKTGQITQGQIDNIMNNPMFNMFKNQ